PTTSSRGGTYTAPPGTGSRPKPSPEPARPTKPHSGPRTSRAYRRGSHRARLAARQARYTLGISPCQAHDARRAIGCSPARRSYAPPIEGSSASAELRLRSAGLRWQGAEGDVLVLDVRNGLYLEVNR